MRLDGHSHITYGLEGVGRMHAGFGWGAAGRAVSASRPWPRDLKALLSDLRGSFRFLLTDLGTLLGTGVGLMTLVGGHIPGVPQVMTIQLGDR